MRLIKCDRCLNDISGECLTFVYWARKQGEEKNSFLKQHDLCEKCAKEIEKLIRKEFNDLYEESS